MKERPYSILYALLFPFVYVAARLFYRRLVVHGIEHFPPKGVPVILVANHQNALIDPLLCCVTAPRQLHFLTRADVFRNPLLRPLVLALNMLPVYRVRDIEEGKNQRNMATFRTVIGRMQRGAAVGIFPEGNHGGKKMIRPLKKGLAQLLEIMGEHDLALKDVMLIPVGIDYDHYDFARRSVVITYGAPFRVDGALYGEGERLERYRKVMDHVRNHMTRVAFHLAPETHYPLLRLGEAMLIEKLGYDAWLDVHRKTQQLRDSLLSEPIENNLLLGEISDVYDELVRRRIDFHALVTADKKSNRAGLADVFLAVLALPGFIMHMPAWQLALAATRTVVIDPQFNSTFRLLFGMLLFGLTWMISIAAAFTLLPAVYASGCLFSLFGSSILALLFSDRLIDLGNAHRARRLFAERSAVSVGFQEAENSLSKRLSRLK